MADQQDILDLLTYGDPVQQAKRQAAATRGKQDFQNVTRDAADQAGGLDMLNFAVGAGSNNPVLAKSMAAMQALQQNKYSPQKLDKGLYVPGTGAYVESPGVADEKEEDRATKRLTAAGVMAARQQAADAAAEARKYAADQALEGRRILALTLGLRESDRKASDAEKAAARVAAADQKATQAMETQLTKAGVPAAAEAIAKAGLVMERHPTGDIPGFGALTNMLPNMAVSEAGVLNRQDLAPLRNITLKNRSGQAVTSGEWERFKDELGSGAGMNATALRRGVAELKRLIAREGVSIGAGYNDEVVKAYNSRGEFQVKRASELTPEEQGTRPGLLNRRKGDAPKSTPGNLHFDAQGNQI